MTARRWTMTAEHAKYATANPPRDGFTCNASAETYGGGCFNCGWNTERELPLGWVWTRKAYGPDFTLWAARDSRWEPTVPDVVDTHPTRVAEYARVCAKVQS